MLIAQYRQAGALFADEKQQPLRLIGALKEAVADLPGHPPGEPIADYNRYMSAATAAGFDYLLVCNIQLLTQPYPGNLAMIAQTRHFALLRAAR